MSTIDIYNYPTDEAQLPAYRIAVMQAALDGKPVEWLGFASRWELCADPIWNWSELKYRIAAPTKTQEQKDIEAFKEWLTSCEGSRNAFWDAWAAALQYERNRSK